MPIINALNSISASGGGTNYGSAKVLIEKKTRSQYIQLLGYMASSYVKIVNVNEMLLLGAYSTFTYSGTTTRMIGNQYVYFWAIEDCTATVKKGSTSTPNTSVGSYNLVAGHQYMAKRYAPSSESGRYFQLKDITDDTELKNVVDSSNNYWQIDFS